MKTRLHTLLALAALPLCGCAQDASTTNQTDSAAMNSTNKALVAYFSATGTTKGVAERLAAAIAPRRPTRRPTSTGATSRAAARSR